MNSRAPFGCSFSSMSPPRPCRGSTQPPTSMPAPTGDKSSASCPGRPRRARRPPRLGQTDYPAAPAPREARPAMTRIIRSPHERPVRSEARRARPRHDLGRHHAPAPARRAPGRGAGAPRGGGGGPGRAGAIRADHGGREGARRRAGARPARPVRADPALRRPRSPGPRALDRVPRARRLVRLVLPSPGRPPARGGRPPARGAGAGRPGRARARAAPADGARAPGAGPAGPRAAARARDRRARARRGAHPRRAPGRRPVSLPHPAPGRVPEATVPLRYLVAAVLAFVLAAAGVVGLARGAAGHHPPPRLAALTHTVTLGWITLTIMGASYQLVPMVLERPIWSERLPRLPFSPPVAGGVRPP